MLHLTWAQKLIVQLVYSTNQNRKLKKKLNTETCDPVNKALV